MKTFAQLTVGDKFYSVYKNSMELREEIVQKVDSIEISCSYSKTIPRFKETKGEKKEYSYYSSDKITLYFVNKAEAIRYSKAQMMKVLFKRIDDAKRSIEFVKQFRKENFELLNHEWTERNIIQLEKELGY